MSATYLRQGPVSTVSGWCGIPSNEENRLIEVSGATSANFVYDGDGNRVRATLGGVTTTYIGNHFEWRGSTSTMTRYYYADGQRVAMRIGSNAPSYLLGDHLGSTSVTANSSGGKVAELRYHPWGGTRFSSGTTPTARRYTGQIEDYYIKAGLLATADGVAGMLQHLQPLAQQLQTWAGQLFR